MTTPLLVTKLFIPPTRPELVLRPRLFDLLNSSRSSQLILVSAPAGFGKTTVVAEWTKALAADADMQVAWLSLDDQDNDVRRFLTYAIAGLNQQERLGVIGVQALARLDRPEPPVPETLLTPVINQIATAQSSVYLVLDDFHVIDAQAVNDVIAFLVDRLPPNMHLVITTREDPVLPLSRLRARGQLTELRAADLRFSLSECAEFLNQAMRLDLKADDVAALEARTEGWIVGLQLAALSLKGQTDPSRLVQSFTGSHRLVLDYLIEEVLSRQPARIQEFLLHTAILDQLTASLCDAVTGQTDGQDVLEALDRANLFVIPLDHDRHWYRYHHLFADLLRQRLRQDLSAVIPTLHQRASRWLEHEGAMPEAIHHALAARDYRRVAELAEIVWPAWNGGSRSLRWLDWVRELPEAILRNRPVLCAASAMALLAGGHLDAAEARLQDVERCLSTPAETRNNSDAGATHVVVVDEAQYRALPARLAMTRAYLAQARGDAPSTLQYVNRTLDLLPTNDDDDRSTATSLKGLAHWTLGDLEPAYDSFLKGLSPNDGNFVTGTFVLADMQMALGHLRQAESVCERGLALSRRLGPPSPIGTETIYTALSHIHREQGDLEAAARDLDTARELGEQIDLPDWKHRWFIARARLKESQGDLDQALELLDMAGRHHVRTPVPDVRPIAALKAKIQVKLGKVMEACQWAHELRLSADDPPSYFREFEHMTLARTLTAQSQLDRDPSLIHTAHGLLDRLAASAETAGRMGSLIEILILKSIAYAAQGNLPAALKPLQQALVLAEPEGYVRVFVDEGPPMAHLLYEALAVGQAISFARRLLGAFPEMQGRLRPGVGEAPLEGLEPLSERERDVLRLIAEGLSNQDIGDRLFLALNTVKAHTRSIYAKLGVNSRTQAIVRARALGVIDTN